MRRGQFGEQWERSVFSLVYSESEVPMGHPDVQEGLELSTGLGSHLCAQLWSEGGEPCGQRHGFPFLAHTLRRGLQSPLHSSY